MTPGRYSSSKCLLHIFFPTKSSFKVSTQQPIRYYATEKRNSKQFAHEGTKPRTERHLLSKRRNIRRSIDTDVGYTSEPASDAAQPRVQGAYSVRPRDAKRPRSSYNMNRKVKEEIPRAEPSASVILISPKNEVLLVHRVKNASTFPSAHVFPGGKHDDDQDGRLLKGDKKIFLDGPEYRRCAIRELFEETGILLARNKSNNTLIQVSPEQREEGRRELQASRMRFSAWIHQHNKNAEHDLHNLIPFSRWVTPINRLTRRFSNQMYLYFLPLTDSLQPKEESTISSLSESTYQLPVYTTSGQPVPDNQEVITAEFAKASTWLEKGAKNEIILFPPQFLLLTFLKQYLENPLDPSAEEGQSPQKILEIRRQNLRSFIRGQLKTSSESASSWSNIFPPTIDPTTPWTRKFISPRRLKVLESSSTSSPSQPMKKGVLALDWPGPELQGKENRSGDTEYVVLARFTPEGPRDLEVRPRSSVMTIAEEKQLVMANGGAESTDFRARVLRKHLITRINTLTAKVGQLRKQAKRNSSSSSSSSTTTTAALQELEAELAKELEECGLSDKTDAVSESESDIQAVKSKL